MALSSIDLLFPTLDPLIAEWYALTPAGREGMPPHCTLIYPWRRAPLADADIAAVARLSFTAGPIRVRIERIARFPDVALYLVPESNGVIEELMLQLWKTFPETPPYGGAFGVQPAAIPHITVTKGSAAHLDQVERALAQRLGTEALEIVVRELCISEQSSSPAVGWGVRARIAL